MNYKKIKKEIKKFVDERDWEQFHTPKNLSMALSVEASELVEIFQWQESDEYKKASSEQKEMIRDEIADIFYYLVRISDKLNIDLEHSLFNKMRKNRKKYPINLVKGKAIKYKSINNKKNQKINDNRKPRPDTNWKNFRFILYANFRMASTYKAMPKFSGSEYNRIGLFKLKGKSFWAFGTSKNIKTENIEQKKVTIKKILKTQIYWEKRNHFFKNKPIDDYKNKDIVRQEAQQYFKSICTYITRKEYNQKFFINNNFDSNAKSVWKNKDIWEQWLEVR